MNSKTKKITPPKVKSLPSPKVFTPQQYDAQLKKVIKELKKR